MSDEQQSVFSCRRFRFCSGYIRAADSNYTAAGVALVLMLASATATAASFQARTFDPTVYKFYAGLNPNAWGFTNAMCGIQLPPAADCWGNYVAYVLQTTPGASTICATLLSAKIQGTTVTYQLDITSSGQCEITRVEM